MINKQINIKDVAKAAGVSVSTVSRVLSGNPRISDQTKQKVMQIVKDFGYKPHAIAASLATSRSNSIGIVIPDSDNEFYSTTFFQEALRGISAAASESGYDVLISPGKPSEYVAVKNLVESRKVDGIILMRAHTKDKCVRFLHNSEFPFVLIGSSNEFEDIYTVDNDNFDAAFELTNHLVDQGMKRIAFIGGDSNFIYTIKRLEGYKTSIAANGIHMYNDYIKLNINTVKNAYKAMTELLGLELFPDAVIITDDTVCTGVMDKIRESGLNVPTDIAVACFNDSLYNRFSIPPITSISVNSTELGKKAAEIICSILSGQIVENRNTKVDFKLFIRNSTRL